MQFFGLQGMMSLSYGLCILATQQILPRNHSLRRKDFSLCNVSSSYLLHQWGLIDINYNKLRQISPCILTLKTFGPIYFSITKRKHTDWRCTFDQHVNCPCDSSYQDFYCKGRCTHLIFRSNYQNSTIFVPSDPSPCRFSFRDVNINICKSKLENTNINVTYFTTWERFQKPMFDKFPNFTMCTEITRSVLPLGTKGVIHSSECSGSCTLELTACKHCRIHFYSYRTFELCMRIKITDSTRQIEATGYSRINFTTSSYKAVLHVCQYRPSLKRQIYYSVIASPLINRTCGEHRTVNTRGEIYFSPSDSYQNYYDCVWVLQGRVTLRITVTTSLLQYNQNIFLHPGTSSMRSSLINDMKTHKRVTQFLLDAIYIRIKGYIPQRSSLHVEYIPDEFSTPYGSFLCSNGLLIPRSQHCNDLYECSDYSDEMSCSGTAEGKKETVLSTKHIIVIICGLLPFIFGLTCFIRFVRRKKAQAARNANQNNGIVVQVLPSLDDEIDNPAFQEETLFPPPAYDEIMANSTVQGNLNTTFTNPESETNDAIEMLPTYEKYMEELNSNLSTNTTQTSSITGNSVHQTNGSPPSQNSNVDDGATRY